MIAHYTIQKTLSQEFETADFRETRKAVWYLNSIPQKNTSAVRFFCLTLEVLSGILLFLLKEDKEKKGDEVIGQMQAHCIAQVFLS